MTGSVTHDEVATRDLDARHVLQPGGTEEVLPATVHRVTGLDDAARRFMIAQGVGVYVDAPVDD